MKNFLTLLVFAVVSVPTLFAQEDTVRIHTLTYDSITTRRGTWLFPDASHTYRKVLMHQTLKCSNLTTQDQYACGEWDYLTYIQAHRHTGLLDSAALTHPFFLVGAAAPDSVVRIDQPTLSQVIRADLRSTLVSGTLDALPMLGIGTAQDVATFAPLNDRSRSQFNFNTADLTSAGMIDGLPINAMRFALSQANGSSRITVRLKNGSYTGGSFIETGWTTVYDQVTELENELQLSFHTPFMWEGTSDLTVDLSVEQAGTNASAIVLGTEDVANTGAQQLEFDGYLDLKDDIISTDASPLSTLGDAITIAFRVFGADILPVNNSFLEALDANGRRILNIHLPWSDGRVYWDAGDDGTGYDRIDRAAASSQIKGQWNNWAFVKNVSTGTMKIYLNGALWHSGTGKTKPLAGITKLRFASNGVEQSSYPGLVDDINVFNSEVPAAVIAEWHAREMTNENPNYSDLLYSFNFNEQNNEPYAINAVDPSTPAWLMGTVRRDRYAAADLRWSYGQTSFRPNVTFVQGDHTMNVDTVLVTTDRPGPQLSIVNFEVVGNASIPVDTIFGALGGWTYDIDPDGNATDSSYVGGTMHYNNVLNYFGEPFDLVENYELGRFITPYGIGLSLGTQGFRWTYDVTDYQWLLHDSVELSAGNQQELIDLEFELIEGTPPRTVLQQQRPWGQWASNSYADLDNDVKMPPVTMDLDPNAAQWSLRTRLTGHGHNSNTGNFPHCCEWKDNTHFLRANGTQVDQWHIWQTNDCALNPVYPQGGTWPGSREGWCPGDVVKDHVVELTPYVSGNTIDLDYDITPVPASNQGMGGGNYVMNMDLFEFSAPAFALDAEVYEVMRPSSDDYQRRDNPICYDPLVVLRNAGGTDLTSVTFTYSVSGGTPLTHTWTGLLKHTETVAVTLPVNDVAFWVGDEASVFTVTTSAPNGGADAHAANDSYHSAFTLPVLYQHDVILEYKTNNRPNENSVTVKRIDGSTLLSRGSHVANTIYRDTLHLTDGCYTFEMLDSGSDGLSYWADTGAGTGYCKLKKANGVTVKSFEAEFGHSIKFAFSVGLSVGLNEMEQQFRLNAFPNPGNGLFTLDLQGIQGSTRMVVLDATGKIVETQRLELHGTDRRQLDLSAQANGLYQVRLEHERGVELLRLMKQ